MATLPRVAVVGTGTMGALHARVIAQSERAELAYVVESQPEVGEQVAQRHGATWRPDLASVEDADAVVVAAPTEAHYALGREVLERGLPLLMEKPLTLELADAEELVQLSAKVDVPLVCGLLERYNPAVMTALRLVEQPRHVMTVRHSPYVPRIRNGVSSDLLIHDVDIAVRLAGTEPSQVRASFGYLHPDSPQGSEDVAEGLLSFPDGMVANVSASRVSQHKVRRLVITEESRLVEVDMLRNSVTIYRHVLNEADPDGLTYRQQTIIEIPALVSSREPLAAQFDRFLDLALGLADPAVERQDILPAHRVIERLREDATRG
jgi:predicted dehydrogenase